MTDETTETTPWETGVSDPADFGVDDVREVLATASTDEFNRVQALETGETGKGRKGITSLTEPADAAPEEPAVGVLGLEVGDEYTTDDGHTARVVSVDGL